MLDSQELVDLDTFKVANILACLPQHVRLPLIAALQPIRPNINYMVMRFEDLHLADDQGIKSLIQASHYQDLIFALSTADNILIERFCRNMDTVTADSFRVDITKLQQSDDPEQFFNAFDAKLSIINTAARLRENGDLVVNLNDSIEETVPDNMINEIKAELQLACEKAMAEVLACYLPEAAAAVLCQRLDRERILTQMLHLDSYGFCDMLSDEEIEELLCGISDDDVF